MTQVTIEGITYNIIAEIKLEGKASEFYASHMAELVRPKGSKRFTALRMKHNNQLELV